MSSKSNRILTEKKINTTFQKKWTDKVGLKIDKIFLKNNSSQKAKKAQNFALIVVL
jgi:hypothetical protein